MLRTLCSPSVPVRGIAGRWIRPPAKFYPRTPRSHASLSSSSSSTDIPLVDLDIDASTGIATLTLKNPPVNSLSLEMNVQLADAIRQARQEPKMQALVMTSSNPKVFSAGLDLKELYPQPPAASDDPNSKTEAESSDRLIRFWKSFQQVYLELYGCRLATVAALEGHAVAGGCMLALCADYRVMSDDSRVTIGLNESQLGIVAPPWLGQQLVDTVGRRTAELGLMRGTLWNPQDAFSINLVDQLVPLAEVRPTALQVASELAKIPESARFLGKKLMRQNRIDRLASNRQEDVDNFVSVITNAATQKRLGMYLASLAKKGSR